MCRVDGIVVAEYEMREVLAGSCVRAVDCCVREVFIAEGCECARCGWAHGVQE